MTEADDEVTTFLIRCCCDVICTCCVECCINICNYSCQMGYKNYDDPSERFTNPNYAGTLAMQPSSVQPFMNSAENLVPSAPPPLLPFQEKKLHIDASDPPPSYEEAMETPSSNTTPRLNENPRQ